MPASTLPTRSAPTSAPLVKMPPPSSGEDRDERSAEAERHERVDRHAIRGAMADNPGEKAEIAGDAEKREAGHQEASHRARAEGDVETAGERFRRCLRRAHVGAHRDVHADEAGGAGQDGPDGEADRHRPRKQKPEHDEHNDADATDCGVLALEIGLRALGDRAGNLLHAGRAGVRRHQAVDRIDAVDDGKEPTDDNQAQKHARKSRCKAAGALPLARFWAPLARNCASPQRRGNFRPVLRQKSGCGRPPHPPGGKLPPESTLRATPPVSRPARRSAATGPSVPPWLQTGRR